MRTGDYLLSWVSLRSGGLKARTVDCYRDNIRLHVLPDLADVELEQLTPEALSRILARICESGHTRTAELVYAILHKALADAQRKHLVRTSPMDDVLRPAHRSRPPQWLEPDEIPVYVAAVAASPYRLAWLLALCCGLRRGELCGLRWQDIDFRRLQIHICNQRQRLSSGALVDYAPKSSAGIRDLPIPADVLPSLRMARQISGYVVLSARSGRPITPSGLDQAHRRLLLAAELPHIRLHDIRHTMGAVAVRQQVPIRVLQYLLGHAHYSTTADIYAHVDLTAAQVALDSITRGVLQLGHR